MRTFEKTHPWLTFRLDLRPVPHKVWMLLGEARSLREQIAGAPLQPEDARGLYEVYLTKGVHATTSIEGNTLSEDEVRRRVEGKLPSQSRVRTWDERSTMSLRPAKYRSFYSVDSRCASDEEMSMNDEIPAIIRRLSDVVSHKLGRPSCCRKVKNENEWYIYDPVFSFVQQGMKKGATGYRVGYRYNLDDKTLWFNLVHSPLLAQLF